MGRKKLTKVQIKAKAAAAAKRVTHGGTMKALGIFGPMINRGIQFSEDKNPRALGQRIGRDQAGFDLTDNTFDVERLAKGYGGGVFNKLERLLFKATGTPSPSVRRKGFKSKVQLGVYHAAALANASGGSSPASKFRRFYHSHYGVNLSLDGIDALDYSKPIFEKVIPTILVSKLMKFIE